MAEGRYYGRLIEAGTKTNANGKPYLELSWLVTHELISDQWQMLVGQASRHTRLWLTDGVWNSPQAVEILERNLKALGFSGDFAAPKFSPELYQGAELICEHDQNGDKTYEKWSPACWQEGRSEGSDIDAPTARRLNAMLKAKAKLAQPAAGAPAAPPAMPPNTNRTQPPPDTAPKTDPDTGDEIPF